MISVTIDENIKGKHEKAALGCLQCRVKVEKSSKELLSEIERSCEDIQDSMKLADIVLLPRINDSRVCYKALGKDPRRYRNSSEAMLRRVIQGKGLYHINNVVEVNNLVSVKEAFSLGTYDTANFVGELVWKAAPEGAQYEGIGKDMLNIEFLPALTDDLGPVGTPTSDSVRAMITENTTEILMLIYSFSGAEGLMEILKEAGRLLEKYCYAEDIEYRVVE